LNSVPPAIFALCEISFVVVRRKPFFENNSSATRRISLRVLSLFSARLVERFREEGRAFLSIGALAVRFFFGFMIAG